MHFLILSWALELSAPPTSSFYFAVNYDELVWYVQQPSYLSCVKSDFGKRIFLLYVY